MSGGKAALIRPLEADEVVQTRTLPEGGYVVVYRPRALWWERMLGLKPGTRVAEYDVHGRRVLR